MRPKVVLSAMALLMLGVLAGWVWSAEEAEQAQVPAAEAEAEVEAAAETEGEAEEVPEKVSGWLCEVKLGTGTTKRMRAGVVKLTATGMARENSDGNNLLVFANAEEGMTYRVSTRQTAATRGEEEHIEYHAEK